VLIGTYLDIEMMRQLNGHRITKNWISPTESLISAISKKYKFLHSTPFNKKVSQWSIYPIETIKIRFGMEVV